MILSSATQGSVCCLCAGVLLGRRDEEVIPAPEPGRPTMGNVGGGFFSGGGGVSESRGGSERAAWSTIGAGQQRHGGCPDQRGGLGEHDGHAATRALCG